MIPKLFILVGSKKSMRLTHFDYIRLVKEAYKRKQANNEQPLLTRSTPAKIRKECVNVLQERFHRKDEETLRAFFGPAESEKQFLQLIRTFETDKFRPLHNFLKESTANTESSNLELLAWLIDFKHRPFRFDNNAELTEEELRLIGNVEQTPQADLKAESPDKPEESSGMLDDDRKEEPGEEAQEASTVPETVPIQKGRTQKLTGALIAFMTLAISAGSMYIIMGNTKAGCMSWVDDHYEKVPCNEEANGRLVLPLNEKKLEQLMRVTRADTITEWSIGKLYYIKDSNQIEYYTEGGQYPEDVSRSLKKLSRYIFDKDSLNRQSIKQLP